MRQATTPTGETEVSILARILGNADGQFPAELARYLVDLQISDRDKARAHDLAVRNQDGQLTPAEKDELLAFAKAATLLAILQSKARLTLGIKLEPQSLP